MNMPPGPLVEVAPMDMAIVDEPIHTLVAPVLWFWNVTSTPLSAGEEPVEVAVVPETKFIGAEVVVVTIRYVLKEVIYLPSASLSGSGIPVGGGALPRRFDLAH